MEYIAIIRYFIGMLAKEPGTVKFEERGLSIENPVKFHKRTFDEDVIIRKHYHSSFEINICENVKGYINVGGRRVDLDRSLVVILQPNLLHSYNISGNGGSIRVWHVGLNLFPFLDGLEIENYLKENYPPFILKNPCKKRTEEYLNLLISEKGFKQASTLLGLFDDILEKDTVSSLKDYGDLFLQKIIAYSERNFSTRILLDAAAEEVHLSRYHFSRKFKSRTGTTFSKYINNLRMENSLGCLNNGMTVSEAAGACGFEDVSYFIKRFRKSYGVTPGQYLKKRIADAVSASNRKIEG